MKRISHHHRAKRRHLASGLGLSGVALALSISSGAGVVSTAGAQTIGGTYTSTVPKDCRVSDVHHGVTIPRPGSVRARPASACW